MSLSPAALILVLCLVASVLVAVHRMVCEQDLAKTTRCDIGFGVPIIVLLAVACGVSGLAVLATAD
jgi:hypothetical protein